MCIESLVYNAGTRGTVGMASTFTVGAGANMPVPNILTYSTWGPTGLCGQYSPPKLYNLDN